MAADARTKEARTGGSGDGDGGDGGGERGGGEGGRVGGGGEAGCRRAKAVESLDDSRCPVHVLEAKKCEHVEAVEAVEAKREVASSCRQWARAWPSIREGSAER